MIGMSAIEFQAFLAANNVVRGKRVIQSWMETGEQIETTLTIHAFDSIFQLWDWIYDVDSRMESAPQGIPQHVIDRREVVAFSRREAARWAWANTRKEEYEEFDRLAELADIETKRLQAEIYDRAEAV